jgi:hypothetical protein
MLFAICSLDRSVSFFLHPDCELESLDTLYRLDRDQWKDDRVWLHAETLDYALQKLEPIFSRAVRQALTLVIKTQASYWHARNPVFFSICQSGEILLRLRELERWSDSKNKSRGHSKTYGQNQARGADWTHPRLGTRCLCALRQGTASNGLFPWLPRRPTSAAKVLPAA